MQKFEEKAKAELTPSSASLRALIDDIAEALSIPRSERGICSACGVDHGNEARLNRATLVLIKRRLEELRDAGASRASQPHAWLESNGRKWCHQCGATWPNEQACPNAPWPRSIAVTAGPAESRASQPDLREWLRFVPPPGPADPPPSSETVKQCPEGHPLLWLSNDVAICDTQQPTLYPVWRLIPWGQSRKLDAVTVPASLTLAHALRRLLSDSPTAQPSPSLREALREIAAGRDATEHPDDCRCPYCVAVAALAGQDKRRDEAKGSATSNA